MIKWLKVVIVYYVILEGEEKHIILLFGNHETTYRDRAIGLLKVRKRLYV